jgi:SnoaL-like domain
MDPRDAANRWRDTWLRSWPTHDADAIAATYASDHVYRSHPFREPEIGGALGYISRAFADEDLGTECWFADPIVDGSRAVVQYWAVLREPGGSPQTLAGTSVLRFGDDGLITEHIDYWVMQDGHREPPPAWGGA